MFKYAEMVQKKDYKMESGRKQERNPKNHTGIPDALKSKYENLSGFSFEDVQVHYGSDKPAQLRALAYTRGNQVFIGPGQEKHLGHELGHVIQQKQGRVKPTAIINGLPVNDEASLEKEADVGSFVPRGNESIQMYEGGTIQMYGEEGSIFDFKNLKEMLKLIIKNKKGEKGWPAKDTNLGKRKLNEYTERVQTLLEDIRQVDLQFLAATSAAFDEDTKIGKEAVLTQEEKVTFEKTFRKTKKGNAEPRKEEIEAKVEEQRKYKGIIMEKLEYIKKIKGQMDERVGLCKNQYMIAVRNHGSARKPKVVNRMAKVMNRKKSEYDAASKYMKDVEKQVSLLEDIIQNASERGYVFNQNALLIKIDERISAYMAIVAPSNSDRFKDIKMGEGGKVDAVSSQLQLSVATPVRTFSWYTKYLMDESAKANNPPMIRSLSVKPEVIDEWQRRAVSEQYLGGESAAHPMNEDFKVPDQYGTPVKTKEAEDLLDSGPELTTYGDWDATPVKLQEGAGERISFDDFKKSIGFGRRKKGEFTPTDVHFFNFGHTAFHEIDDQGKPKLYSPEKARTSLEQYNSLMDQLIKRCGKEPDISEMKRKGILSKDEIEEGKFLTNVAILLEANHCLPPGGKEELSGNSVEVLERERAFAYGKINEASNREVYHLTRLTKNRFLTFSDKWRKGKPMAQEKEKAKILSDSGILYELQLLNKDRLKVKERLDLENLFIDSEDFFQALNGVSEKEGNRPHIIAICFKLLRVIMEPVNKIPTESVHEALEPTFFTKRKGGDYYDALNRRDGKTIDLGDGRETFIPFDKMTSVGRFVPEGGKPKHKNIPFIGGASGTTRDMSRDLLANGFLEDEKNYWDFQLMNAAFMITYSYHSFLEVMFRAATTREEYKNAEPITGNIFGYLEHIKNDDRHMINLVNIVDDIKSIVKGDSYKNVINRFVHRMKMKKTGGRWKGGGKRKRRKDKERRAIREQMLDYE